MPMLAVHPTAISIFALPVGGSASSPVLPNTVAFPSRYPAGSPPRTVAGPSGSTFLYTSGGSIVWEYDTRGRRVGEISSKDVEFVAPFKNGVAVAAAGELRVFRRGAAVGKWALDSIYEGPSGRVTAMSADGEFVVVCANEVAAYNVESGVRLSLILSVETPVVSVRVCALPSPMALFPTPDGIAAVPLLESSDEAPAKLASLSLGRPIMGIAVAEHPPCIAVAAEGPEGMVALLNSNLETTKTFSFKNELAGIAFVDGTTVAARTTTGRLMVADINTKASEPDVIRVSLKETVLGIHGIPPAPPRSRESAGGPRSVSERARPLIEARNANVPTPPPGMPKGKDKIAFDQAGRAVSAPVHDIHLDNRHTRDELKAARNQATAETPRDMRPPPVPRTANRTVSDAMPPASTASTVRIRPASIPEGNEPPSPAPRFRPSALRTTALPDTGVVGSPPPSESGSGSGFTRRGRADSGSGSDVQNLEGIEQMRQEIANLQLDMLRMGRGLKNEIRSAIAPLVDEIKSNREVMARQAAEIERLRRGY